MKPDPLDVGVEAWRQHHLAETGGACLPTIVLLPTQDPGRFESLIQHRPDCPRPGPPRARP